MKQICSYLCILFISIALSLGCAQKGGDDGGGGGGGSAGNATTMESNDQQAGDTEFQFDTTTKVDLATTITDADTNAPIAQVSITVTDPQNRTINSGTTNADGIADFTLVIENSIESVTVIVRHEQYEEFSFVVNDVKKLAEIAREIKLKKKVVVVPIVDSDGDGVADADDEFPNEKKYAKSVKGAFTLVFEDLYPVPGDADFNDAVVKLTIEERINAQNKIAYIKITAQALASGAGYNNQFGINVLGSEYLLIANFKGDLNDGDGTRIDDPFQPSAFIRVQEIVLDTPIDRSEIAPMPYDPFLIPNGVNWPRGNVDYKGEVHLPFVDSAYKNSGGMVLDSTGFPWALLVPGNWHWPLSGRSIYDGYPDFRAWYESRGAVSANWYTNVVGQYVYPYTLEGQLALTAASKSALVAFVTAKGFAYRYPIGIALFLVVGLLVSIFVYHHIRIGGLKKQ